MSNFFQFFRAWLIFVISALIIAFFPYIRSMYPWLQAFTKNYDSPLLAEIATDSSISAKVDTAILKDTMATVHLDSLYLDSLAHENRMDSIEEANEIGFQLFFEQLALLESNPKKKVNILWFGDSMIEGDLITQDVRDLLQEHFGGKGVGYVPITSIVNKYRYTIRHDFSDNWESYNIVSGESPELSMNWNGEYFTAQSDTDEEVKMRDTLSVEYRGSGAYSGTRNLYQPTLLYGHRIKDSLYLDQPNIVKFHEKSYELQGSNQVNSLPFGYGPYHQVQLQFLLKPDQPLFGMHFHSGSGIELSNISSRGNSGLTLSRIPVSTYKGMSRSNSPSLIVLQYGVNTIQFGVTEYGWYERAMDRVVKYLKRIFPSCSILIVSLADRSRKIDGTMKTDSSVIAMNQVLFNISEKNEVGYFNLYEKMGGYNSMREWVEANPPLANKDYTHFNSRGSRKVAHLFYDFIMEEYGQYKQKDDNYE